MSTAESAPSGAGRLGQERPNLLSKAETLLVPSTPFSREYGVPYPLSFWDMVDFDQSPKPSDELRQVLSMPWVAELEVPVAAQRFWILSHQLACAELIRDAWKEGVLSDAGIELGDEELIDIMTGFTIHDIATVRVGLTDETLNPRQRRGPLTDQERPKMNRHPGEGVIVLEGYPSTPRVRKWVGTHHHYEIIGALHKEGDEKNRYGLDPNSERLRSVEPTDRRKLRVFPFVDVLQAATHVHRLYQEPKSSAEATEELAAGMFADIDPRLRRFLSERAYAMRDYALVATPKMDELVARVRRPEENLWGRSDDLAAIFAGVKT